MGREEKNIFYIGIEEGKAAGKRELLARGLPIRKLGRKFPYLSWEGRNVTVSLQVHFALLPQKEKRFWRQQDWKGETVEKVLEKTAENAALRWECREQAITPLLGKRRTELPPELMAVCLYQHRPFDQICLSLPEEGEYFAEQAMWLLRPYLPRMRKAFICGGENENGDKARERLYEEFGLVLMEIKKPEPGMVWLDLREEETLEGMGKSVGFKEKSVNRSQTWNFLDTAVKNGYNTEVN